MAKYLSPFQFGTLATNENFIDRQEDRALLKQLLSSHINVMLISPRRWGKSSLVKRAMSELADEDNNVRICYIDAFSIGSESEFYRTFASQVIACASSKMERWIEDAKKFLTGVIPQVVINDQVTDFMAFDLKFVPQERDKMAILQLPELLAKERASGLSSASTSSSSWLIFLSIRIWRERCVRYGSNSSLPLTVSTAASET